MSYPWIESLTQIQEALPYGSAVRPPLLYHTRLVLYARIYKGADD